MGLEEMEDLDEEQRDLLERIHDLRGMLRVRYVTLYKTVRNHRERRLKDVEKAINYTHDLVERVAWGIMEPVSVQEIIGELKAKFLTRGK